MVLRKGGILGGTLQPNLDKGRRPCGSGYKRLRSLYALTKNQIEMPEKIQKRSKRMVCLIDSIVDMGPHFVKVIAICQDFTSKKFLYVLM